MLKGYKTYIVGGVTIIGAVASYLVGDSSIQECVQLVVNAALAMCIRHGVATTNKGQ